MKSMRYGAGLIALCMTFATPARATIVTMGISGNWGVLSNGTAGADPFSGTLTYDTASLTYQNGIYSALYGSSSGQAAGSYTVSWAGDTYSAAIRTIQVQQLAECTEPGSPSCVRIDMTLQSALYGYGDGRFYALLDNAAPFDSVLLPGQAPASTMAYYASLSLPQATTEGRFTSLGSIPESAPPNAGATLRFGTVGAGAVPEPGPWAMMILGFGAIGILTRGRRRTGVTAPA